MSATWGISTCPEHTEAQGDTHRLFLRQSKECCLSPFPEMSRPVAQFLEKILKIKLQAKEVYLCMSWICVCLLGRFYVYIYLFPEGYISGPCSGRTLV